MGYYEKLAKDSYKDYRWSLVLGRLYDLTGNTAGSVEAFRRTVVNEPQRIDFRQNLAAAMVRAGMLDDAVAELRKAWEIDGKNPAWLVQVARESRTARCATTLRCSIGGDSWRSR